MQTNYPKHPAKQLTDKPTDRATAQIALVSRNITTNPIKTRLLLHYVKLYENILLPSTSLPLPRFP